MTWPEIALPLSSRLLGTVTDLQRAKEEFQGLGLFVRSLVGLDRAAAKRAVDGFLAGKNPSASQIEFLDMIINHLTEHGTIEAARLYESPFTDITPHSPDGLFNSTQIDELLAALTAVRVTALPS